MFSLFSGLKLNVAKCELCGIGLLKGVETALCEVKNVNLETESIKILGVHFTYNKTLFTDKNFISVVDKIENVLKMWRLRNLTLLGKITIFKTLAISKIIYISYMSTVPTKIVMIYGIFDHVPVFSGPPAPPQPGVPGET